MQRQHIPVNWTSRNDFKQFCASCCGVTSPDTSHTALCFFPLQKMLLSLNRCLLRPGYQYTLNTHQPTNTTIPDPTLLEPSPSPHLQTGLRDVYLTSIDALPLVQSPQVYGLHANADISYYTSATKALWLHLVDLQPRSAASGSGVTREDFIAGVAKDIGGKLPEPFDLPVIKREIGIPSPTQVGTEKCIT